MSHLRLSLLATVILWGVAAAVGFSPVHAQQGPPQQAVGMLQIDDVSASVVDAARASVTGPDGVGKDGPLSAVNLELAVLYHQHRAAGAQGIRQVRGGATPRGKTAEDVPRRTVGRVLSPISEDGQFVTVEAIAAADAPGRLLQALERLGLEDGATAGNVVSGRLPISAIEQAAALSSLRGMVPSYARTSAGRVDSEADTAHATDVARREKGVDGRGQKVCALSDSYDQSGSALTTAAEDIESGDLPGAGNPEGNTMPVDVLEDAGGSDEGRAMLQLIHDIAPGAELGFHTALGGLGAFASGIRALADPADGNCTIVVDDIRYNTEPFYQDGPVSNAVDDVVTNDGVAYFSSAGNDGQNSYEAPFRDSGEPGVINSSSDAHDFDPSGSVDTRQEIVVEGGGEFRIFTFQWTDPSAQVQGSTGPDTDIDVALVDQDDNIVAESSIDNIADGRPFESLEFTNEAGSEVVLNLVIEKAAGPDPEEVKYVYSGSGYSVNEYDTLGPTIYGHPMAEGAMAVAAAPFFNTVRYNPNSDPAALEAFSSKGGIPILFNQSGSPLLTPETRNKPDVTGTDGVDNTFFGSDIPDTFFNGVDADPHPNFFGTSAAAPNVAAIAALIKQARPGFTPADVYQRLEENSDDVTTRETRDGDFVAIAAGDDPWSGSGFVQAPEAVPTPVVANLQTSVTNPAFGAVELSWSVAPGSNIQSYEVERRYFNEPFEVVARPDGPPVTLDTLGLGIFTFRIRWTRTDGTQGTSATVTDTLGLQDLQTEEVAMDEEGRSSVALSWNVPRGTRDFSYRVERQRGDEGQFRLLGQTTETIFEAERQVPGTYNYRVVAADARGNTLTSAPVRTELEFEDQAFAVGPYPNPAQDAASLDLTVQNEQTVTVEVFNTLGKRVYMEERSLDARVPVTLRLDAQQWSSGMYFLRVKGTDFTETRKVIVTR